MLKFDEHCLPIFLTCAHCAKKKGTSTCKSHVILTPATTPNFDESFIFLLNPTDRQTGVYGCNAEDIENALDFLALFLNYEKNESRQQIRNFWRSERSVNEGDAINTTSTHAYISQSGENFPVIQEVKVSKFLLLLMKTVALHDVVGIRSISGKY